jgi:hypothetical protein
MNTYDELNIKPYLKVVEAEAGEDGMRPSLAEYLAGLPRGPIQYPGPVMRLLAEAWDDMKGSGDGGMKSDKILGRCEELLWESQHLTFKIERHGATVYGSSRAELQHWCVNPITKDAYIAKRGHRQLYTMSKRLDVYALAQDVAKEILAHADSDHLKWYPDGRVKVVVGKVIPETCARTTVSRRARYRQALIALLKALGWDEVALHTYRKASVSEGS